MMPPPARLLIPLDSTCETIVSANARADTSSSLLDHYSTCLSRHHSRYLALSEAWHDVAEAKGDRGFELFVGT
jgi:hypothetical protein